MRIKFTAGNSTNYVLAIEWKSLYKYQSQLICVSTGEIVEYVDSSPMQSILKAKYILGLKGLSVLSVDSIVEYLNPINEVLDAVSQLAENAEVDFDRFEYAS